MYHQFLWEKGKILPKERLKINRNSINGFCKIKVILPQKSFVAVKDMTVNVFIATFDHVHDSERILLPLLQWTEKRDDWWINSRPFFDMPSHRFPVSCAGSNTFWLQLLWNEYQLRLKPTDYHGRGGKHFRK